MPVQYDRTSAAVRRQQEVSAMSRGYNDRSRQRVSLLVRNLPLDVRYKILCERFRQKVRRLVAGNSQLFVYVCRAEEVREKFERFGEIRDVYLPRDFHTGYGNNMTLRNAPRYSI